MTGSPQGLVEEERGGLVRLTINRPEKANAIDVELLDAIRRAIERASADDHTRVLVLAGSGERVFSAGADLPEIRAAMAAADGAKAFDAAWSAVAAALASAELFTVAALNGTCAGGGIALASACDVRVAVRSAELFYPVLAHRVMPQADSVARLNTLIGPARTKMLLLGGARIDAETAERWGLVDLLVQPDELHQAVERLCAPALDAERSQLRCFKTMCRT